MKLYKVLSFYTDHLIGHVRADNLKHAMLLASRIYGNSNFYLVEAALTEEVPNEQPEQHPS